jgi:hypothetical protein
LNNNNVAEEELASHHNVSPQSMGQGFPRQHAISPVIINKAISELFLLGTTQPPKIHHAFLAGSSGFLLEQEKWFREYLE